jgi:hypothetical protein
MLDRYREVGIATGNSSQDGHHFRGMGVIRPNAKADRSTLRDQGGSKAPVHCPATLCADLRFVPVCGHQPANGSTVYCLGLPVPGARVGVNLSPKVLDRDAASNSVAEVVEALRRTMQPLDRAKNSASERTEQSEDSLLWKILRRRSRRKRWRRVR